ncbi:hypothetical protein ThidrDRAFT_3217 [Thiorhodococcus drewsii AZ1]|uniref:Uncharacterized protein n=1 Tax=Thiorhodococcus drewsii AZ1 TaxID=765913 RepID=G2E4K4_9GAMM|nr:hypothetical protein [Thiorhodococcus drewsii]EGV29625.1 hypothetical protein ThidrDRAFT_3217 [Thiorhodococcus drewsii AZ1]
MHTTAASIRALRTVALFTTGVATYSHTSAFAQLPGWPRLLRAAQRLAESRAIPNERTLDRRPEPLRS